MLLVVGCEFGPIFFDLDYFTLFLLGNFGREGEVPIPSSNELYDWKVCDLLSADTTSICQSVNLVSAGPFKKLFGNGYIYVFWKKLSICY